MALISWLEITHFQGMTKLLVEVDSQLIVNMLCGIQNGTLVYKFSSS